MHHVPMWTDPCGLSILLDSRRRLCATFKAYRANGGRLEVAQRMANHQLARTTGLYDRRGDETSLDEVERILI